MRDQLNERDYNLRIKKLKETNPFLSQTDMVYQLLLEDILQSNRIPGSRINQEELVDCLGVSRSPVRDALKRLVEGGLVIQKGTKGYNIYIPTLRDAKRFSEFRQAIEIQSGILAMKRIKEVEKLRRNCEKLRACPETDVKMLILLDIEFHDILVDASNNEYMIEVYHQFDHRLRHLRNCTVRGYMKDSIITAHEGILSAIKNRDADRVRFLIHNHLEGNVDDIAEADAYVYC